MKKLIIALAAFIFTGSCLADVSPVLSVMCSGVNCNLSTPDGTFIAYIPYNSSSTLRLADLKPAYDWCKANNQLNSCPILVGSGGSYTASSVFGELTANFSTNYVDSFMESGSADLQTGFSRGPDSVLSVTLISGKK